MRLPVCFEQRNCMEIKTERLALRPADRSYLESTHEYASDIENTRYMMYLPFESREETLGSLLDAEKQWKMEAPERCEFVILREDMHIGTITLYFLKDRAEGELGWVLNRKYWGCGYVGEAALAVMDYARAEWGMKRIIACCDSENHASRRVMEKLGMKYHSTGERKNRSSAEQRTELVYEIML